ncbi:MAG: O-antigen/teichoic acid export membrane protein [Gammaproteobacteria bacterium]
MLKADWFKNVTALITGTVIGQFIPIALQPVLRRVFSPEEFGVFAVFASVYGIISVASALRFELAINNPEKDQDAFGLVWLSLWINLGVSVLTCATLIIARAIGLEGMVLTVTMIIGIPLAVLFSGIFRALNYWLIRKEQFKLSARNKVYRRAAQGLAQLITGFLKVPSGLIYSEVVGHAANVGSAAIKLKNSFRSYPILGKGHLKAIATRYKEFALYSSGPAVLNAFCMLFPSIIILEKFGLEATGQYDLSRTLLMIPMALVGVSVSQIVLQQTNKLKDRPKERNRFYGQLLMVLLAISIPIPPFLLLFGEPIFAFFFGFEWVVAAQISTVLSFSFALKAVVSPFSMILVAFEKLKLAAYWQVLYAGFIGLIFVWEFTSFEHFITFFTVGEVLVYVIYGLIILSVVRKQN